MTAFGLRAILAALACLTLVGCGDPRLPDAKKVLVLGIDGLDPTILARFMDEGKLPGFRRLREQGDLRELTTSIPPQSPVAWSNFITGMNPGGHGIFDFVHRELEANPPTPKFSASGAEPIGLEISIGKYYLPLTGGSQINLRDGRAFWEILADHDIPASVYKIPVNYPPSKSLGVTFSGMGTPDVLGTQGTSSFFTDDPPTNAAGAAGVNIVTILVENNKIETALEGPPDALLNTDAQRDSPPLLSPFTVYLDPENNVAKISINGQDVILEEGEWSGWINVQFPILKTMGLDVIPPLEGIVRFYLKEISPDFRLYVSPINFDPANPSAAISEPAEAAADLSEFMGSAFYTQNMPEDFNALGAGVLDPADFIQQSNLVVDERKRMFDYALDRFNTGLLFFYVGSVDLNCHMFYRTLDDKHPAYTKELGEKFGNRLITLYEEADHFVQKALEKVDDETLLLVMSDHGFAPFYRQVQLANWLKAEGYIVLDDNGSLDWSKTRAYSMGINGLYLNLKGREKCGIVEPGPAADQLLEEISFKLLKLRDTDPRFTDGDEGETVVHQIYKGKECYSGDHVKESPDLIIGYNRGYRSSDDAGLCTVTDDPILTDRNEWWSGDHCMSHTLVPGILLSNRALGKNDPALYDLPFSILETYGIKAPKTMVGSTIF